MKKAFLLALLAIQLCVIPASYSSSLGIGGAPIPECDLISCW